MLKRLLILASSLVAASFIFAVGGFIFVATSFTQPQPFNQTIMATQLNELGITNPTALLESGTPLAITSAYGYSLDTTLLPSAETTDNYIILNHSFGTDKLASLSYYQLFHDLGFNVIVYSSRGHGESGGDSISYGYYEKYDLQTIVNEILALSPNAVIGLHGVGLGAATVLQYAQIASLEIDFYIAQGAFSDLSSLINFELTQNYPEVAIPVLQPLIEWWLTVMNQIPVSEVSPVTAISEIPQPVLLIYGTDDPYLTFSESLSQEVTEPFKTIYLVEGATANTVATTDAQTYKTTITNFIVESFAK